MNTVKIKPLPPTEFLHECFDYIPETGRLMWRRERPLHHFKNAHGMRIHNSKWGGKEAGTILDFEGTKRRVIRLFTSAHYMTHRLVFVLCGEPDPGALQVDHIDGNAMNNRRDNLRLASNQMNNANVGRKTYLGRVRHLPKGVYPNGVGKWQAKIKVNYKTVCLGTYPSPEQASAAYMETAAARFGAFARQD